MAIKQKKRVKAYNPHKVAQAKARSGSETHINVHQTLRDLANKKRYAQYVPKLLGGKQLKIGVEGWADTTAYLIVASNPSTEAYDLLKETLPFFDHKNGIVYTWDIIKPSTLMSFLNFNFDKCELEFLPKDAENATVIYGVRELGVEANWTIDAKVGLIQYPPDMDMVDFAKATETANATEHFAKEHGLICDYEVLEINPKESFPVWRVTKENGQDVAKINYTKRNKDGSTTPVTIFDVLSDTLVSYLEENEGYGIFSLEATLTITEKPLNV